jgi:double-stranded uracil-DNA glycosylase
VVATSSHHAPGVLAFVGKRAAGEVLGQKPGRYGEQDVTIDVTRVWVVPSTSGAARGFWDIGPWRALAATLR